MSVTMSIGDAYDEEAQAGSFMNATLQSAGDEIAFSVATYVKVPRDVASQGVDAVARFLSIELGMAAGQVSSLSFEVQVGPSASVMSQRES